MILIKKYIPTKHYSFFEDVLNDLHCAEEGMELLKWQLEEQKGKSG